METGPHRHIVPAKIDDAEGTLAVSHKAMNRGVANTSLYLCRYLASEAGPAADQRPRELRKRVRSVGGNHQIGPRPTWDSPASPILDGALGVPREVGYVRGAAEQIDDRLGLDGVCQAAAGFAGSKVFR